MEGTVVVVDVDGRVGALVAGVNVVLAVAVLFTVVGDLGEAELDGPGAPGWEPPPGPDGKAGPEELATALS